jgi:L-alanine-DL-glutamate epimerase-like enolase superfamily enzyme
VATSEPGFPPALSRVEAVHVRVPFRRPFLDPTGEYTHRRAWLLRLVDGDGREGLGQAVLHPAATETAASGLATLIRELVSALVEGRAPSASQLLAEGEPGRAALAAVDGAMGGLQSSATATFSIPVAAIVGFGGPDAGAEAAAQAVELGFGTLKLRAGAERRTDQLVDRLRAIREAVGPEPRLRVDVAGAWDLQTAVERLSAMEPYRIEFVEQPLAAWDLTGHAALRDRVEIPIALDESIDSEGAGLAALAEGSADLLVIKLARLGGVGPAARLVSAAAGRGVATILGTFDETGVGIAASLRAAAALGEPPTRAPAAGGASARAQAVRRNGAETFVHDLASAGILTHDLLSEPLPIERGRMGLPAKVGLDEMEVRRLAVERIELTVG